VEYRVTHRFARISARKTRYVIDLVRGRTVNEALQILNFTRRRAADMVKKLLNSAVANVTYEAQRKRQDIDTDSLRIVKAYVDGGPTVKRWRPRARGRAMPIRKRTSHIVLVLSQEAAATNSQ
jgi:large subunit ribosomal protein L22